MPRSVDFRNNEAARGSSGGSANSTTAPARSQPRLHRKWEERLQDDLLLRAATSEFLLIDPPDSTSKACWDAAGKMSAVLLRSHGRLDKIHGYIKAAASG